MKKLIPLFLFLFSFRFDLQAQQPDSLLKKLDSLEKKADTAGQVNNTDPAAYNEVTKITVPVYFTLLQSNLKQQLLSPFRASKKDWINVAGMTALTIGLSYADKPVQRQALQWRRQSKTLRDVSGVVTEFGGLYELYTLAAVGTYGWIFKREKMRTTTLLATQAYITGASIAMLAKLVTGRERPAYQGDTVPGRGRFHGPFGLFGERYRGGTIRSAFPSGHTAVAFAAATVFAMEYSDKPIIPIIAYTSASLIGISRITENKHWVTDVFVGALLGYFSGRQVVNNYHRYAKLKRSQRKPAMSFQLHYQYNTVMPGVVWRF